MTNSFNTEDNRLIAKRVLALIDLTTLNADDTEDKIRALCEKAVTPYGNVAAVCIYSKFVKLAKQILAGTGIKIATVANFPEGDQSLQAVLSEVEQEIRDGADEIDLVWNYKLFLAGDKHTPIEMVSAAKEICKEKARLKIILETGMFPSSELIYNASHLLIEAGADFLKTSTGKVKINATLEAAEAMLLAIKESGKPVGFKAAGGIRTLEEANKYLLLSDKLMGDLWVNTNNFRFGASGLLGEVLAALSSGKSEAKDDSGY